MNTQTQPCAWGGQGQALTHTRWDRRTPGRPADCKWTERRHYNYSRKRISSFASGVSVSHLRQDRRLEPGEVHREGWPGQSRPQGKAGLQEHPPRPPPGVLWMSLGWEWPSGPGSQKDTGRLGSARGVRHQAARVRTVTCA